MHKKKHHKKIRRVEIKPNPKLRIGPGWQHVNIKWDDRTYPAPKGSKHKQGKWISAQLLDGDSITATPIKHKKLKDAGKTAGSKKTVKKDITTTGGGDPRVKVDVVAEPLVGSEGSSNSLVEGQNREQPATSSLTRMRGSDRTKPAASSYDMLRVRMFGALLNRGVEELDAIWTVISDADIGYNKFRTIDPIRPPDHYLARSIRSLLSRAVPDEVNAARETALSQLASMRKDATKAVRSTVRGKHGRSIGDIAHRRLQVDAAKLILENLGVGGKSQPQVNVAVNQQQQNLVVGANSILDVIESRRAARKARRTE